MSADILIVDDEADIRELVAGILDDEGHRSAHGRDIRRRARRHRRRAARARDPRHLDARAAGWTGWRCSTWSRSSIPTCR